MNLSGEFPVSIRWTDHFSDVWCKKSSFWSVARVGPPVLRQPCSRHGRHGKGSGCPEAPSAMPRVVRRHSGSGASGDTDGGQQLGRCVESGLEVKVNHCKSTNNSWFLGILHLKKRGRDTESSLPFWNQPASWKIPEVNKHLDGTVTYEGEFFQPAMSCGMLEEHLLPWWVCLKLGHITLISGNFRGRW